MANRDHTLVHSARPQNWASARPKRVCVRALFTLDLFQFCKWSSKGPSFPWPTWAKPPVLVKFCPVTFWKTEQRTDARQRGERVSEGQTKQIIKQPEHPYEDGSFFVVPGTPKLSTKHSNDTDVCVWPLPLSQLLARPLLANLDWGEGDPPPLTVS